MKRVTIVLIARADGTTQVETVKKAGTDCKGIVDDLAAWAGANIDQSSRRDTADLHVQPSANLENNA